MRCFIAIDISADVREAIGNVVGKVRTISKGIRWIPPENIHITLKFLGDVKEDRIQEIERLLLQLCVKYSPFTVNVSGMGAFPSLKRPNVLWVGINDSAELRNIYQDIEKAMSTAGFKEEGRKFSPHLTIARVKDTRGIEQVIKEFATFRDAIFGSIYIEEVLLMKSVLKPAGAEYFRVAGFKLTKIKD